jgi:hypothetical protein
VGGQFGHRNKQTNTVLPALPPKNKNGGDRFHVVAKAMTMLVQDPPRSPGRMDGSMYTQVDSLGRVPLVGTRMGGRLHPGRSTTSTGTCEMRQKSVNASSFILLKRELGAIKQASHLATNIGPGKQLFLFYCLFGEGRYFRRLLFHCPNPPRLPATAHPR